MSTTSILEHRIAPKDRGRDEGRSFDHVGEPFAMSYRRFFPQLSCSGFSYVLWRSSRASWQIFRVLVLPPRQAPQRKSPRQHVASRLSYFGFA